MPTAAKEERPTRPPATFETYDPEAYGQIVHPNRFDWYLMTRWLPDLGNDALVVIKVLRNELYYNPAKKALRDECEMSMEELARRCNLSRTKLFALFKENRALCAFVERQGQIKIKGDRPHRDVNAFRVCMTDPIHPADEERYRMLLEQRGAEQIARETRPKYRMKSAASYESGNGTHSAPMSSEMPPYESGNGTHIPPMSSGSERHKDQILPPDLFTKDLTPAAAPSHKCVPPEGEGESAPQRSIERPENQRGLALVRNTLKRKQGIPIPADGAGGREAVHGQITASLNDSKKGG